MPASRRLVRRLAVAALALASPAIAQQPIQAPVFVSGLLQPVDMLEHPTRPGVFFVAEQRGTVRVIESGLLSPDPVIDIASIMNVDHPERGLVSLAIDPANDNHLYLHYTRNPVGASRVDRFTITADAPWTADFDSRLQIIDRPQPSAIHSGNAIRFGPDGALYIAYGDGGPVGDPNMQGQNRDSIFGSIVRIAPLESGGYAVPPDNPFVDADGADEIWLYGLRNPWRFSFDVGPCSTGGILLGDVGETRVEEVNFALPSEAGANFGWSCLEGSLPFADCEPAPGESFTPPLFEYDRAAGLGRSVTGGIVYRGAAMPHNRGRAFFGDFIAGTVMSVELIVDESAGTVSAANFRDHSEELTGSPVGSLGLIVSFARDAEGELYIVDYSGVIRRIEAQTPAADITLDGAVDAADLAQLIASWGASDCGPADLTNNQIVDAADLAALIASWGD
jgi:glucose/arabinose dehydrogenase